MKKVLILLAMTLALVPRPTLANVAGGGTGQGPDVTVVDHHDGRVTLANGIVSIVIDTTKARLDRVTYTHTNSGIARTSDVLLPAADNLRSIPIPAERLPCLLRQQHARIVTITRADDGGGR